jgi:hypothetical protein
MLDIPTDLWLPEQPDNKYGIQQCTVVNLSGAKNKIGVEDVYCVNKFNPLCEYVKK